MHPPPGKKQPVYETDGATSSGFANPFKQTSQIPLDEGDISQSVQRIRQRTLQTVKEHVTNTAETDGVSRVLQEITEACPNTSSKLFPQEHPKQFTTNDVKVPQNESPNEPSMETAESLSGLGAAHSNHSSVESQKHLSERVTSGSSSVLAIAPSNDYLPEPHKHPSEEFTRGASLTVITGGVGDGKTTVGYTVLSKLNIQGRMIFHAFTPEELLKICRHICNPVIMIKYIFGEYIFDETSWKHWQTVLNNVLSSKRDGPIILLIGNNFVIQPWLKRAETLPPYTIIDISKDDRTPQEKMNILRALEERYPVMLTEECRNFICGQDIRYGFPKLCKVYLQYNEQMTVESVFRNPSMLDNHMVSKLLTKTSVIKLFKRLLICDGKFDISDEPCDEMRLELSLTAKDFEDIILFRQGNTYSFCYGYMYDVVAKTLWKVDSRFVIDRCPLTYLHKTLRPSNEHTRSDSPFLHVNHNDEKHLVNRFLLEIGKGNLLLVLSHEACKSATFARRFMDSILVQYKSMETIILLKDRTHRSSFLFFSMRNKSCEILKIIIQGLKEVSVTIVNEIVFGLCDSASSDSLDLLVRMGYVLDMDIEDAQNLTPIMLAANTGNEDFVMKVLSEDVDINASDAEGQTVLHYVCENGLIRPLQIILKDVEDVNRCDNSGRTPLHIACEFKHLLIIERLLDKGVTIDSRSLHVACKSGEVKILELLLDKGGDIQAVSDIGDTLLHSACDGGIRLVELLVKRGVDVNKPGFNGRAPLQTAQMLENYQIVDYLLTVGAKEMV